MTQDIHYPDPEQLKTFAEEPMPFQEFHGTDLEMLEDGRIRVGIANVEYIYHPTYLLETDEYGEVTRFEYPDWPISAKESFDDSMAISIVEDFISGVVPADEHYEAYWVLEKIEIENPNLYQ